ncbi:MAG: flotillin family protein [Sandaracinaceae bacterium]
MTMLIWLAVAGGALFALAALAVSAYRKVGPNEVLIVSGRPGTYLDPSTGERHEKAFRIYHGGGTLVVPFKERVDVMSVELMTLEIRTPEFFTKFGVPIVVDGIAQIKVRSDDLGALATAAEMFLSKSAAEMNDIAHQMMQGHLRAVISTMPFEEIHANPEAFAQQVQRLTAADLANMGIQVVSFTIREVRDPSGFLQALGRPQLAEVQKNAELGEAHAQKESMVGRAGAEREAKVSSAAAQRESRLAQIASEVAVADATAEKDCRLHALGSRVAEAKASSDLAYELAAARERKQVMTEQLALEELRIQQREKELALEIEKPALAERRRIETLAEAQRVERLALAEADAAAERARGLAEASVIRERGAAEAERARALAIAEADGLAAKLHAEAVGMQEKALAWQQYGDAALGQLLIERLPEIASAVAAPLGKIDRIVLVGGGDGGTGVEKITGSVANVIAQLPAVVEGVSGIDLSALLARVAKGSSPADAKVIGPEDVEVLSAAE